MATSRHRRSDARLDRLIEIRRALHMRPELSGDEGRTAAFIAAHLRGLGLPTETGIGGHGVVAVLQGGGPGATVAYRADIDALPIQETSTHPYASTHLGISHACGHDVHVAVALGLAEHLASKANTLHGRVVFVFQPAEESLDGARAMLQAGLLARYAPDLMLATHVFPMPVGTVGVAEGVCCAGMEEFRVRVISPAGGLEALLAEMIQELEGLSTERPPIDADGFARLLERMEAGDPDLRRTRFVSSWPLSPSATSPEQILGLASIVDDATRQAFRSSVRDVLDVCSARVGATYDLTTTFGNPPLVNDGPLVQAMLPHLEGALGPAAVVRFRAPYPFAHEDLSRYAERLPTALVWLGTQDLARGIPSILHTATYDVDERALAVGVDAMAAVIRGMM